MIKRAIDIGFSAAALLVCLPFLMVIATAIAMDAGLPVLFRQERVGRYGKPFTMIKFRTMRTGAGSAVTAGGDSRVTRIGRLLRRNKLDELPQLWNVLRGEMSLVGPRPEIPVFVSCYPERYARILRVRPGLSDPASLAYFDEERMLAGAADPEQFYVRHILPHKLDLAEEYLGRSSVWGDAAVLARSLRAVLQPRGGPACRKR